MAAAWKALNHDNVEAFADTTADSITVNWWSDAQQSCLLHHLQKKNAAGRHWVTSLMPKAVDVAWDRWQQRNDSHDHTLHPWRAAEVIESSCKELTATCVSERQNFPLDSESALLDKRDHLFLP
jgi:hypothetical protein